MRALLIITILTIVASAAGLLVLINNSDPQNASLTVKVLLFVTIFLFVASIGTLLSHFIESAIRGAKNGFFASYFFKTQQYFAASLTRGLITGLVAVALVGAARIHLI